MGRGRELKSQDCPPFWLWRGAVWTPRLCLESGQCPSSFHRQRTSSVPWALSLKLADTPERHHLSPTRFGAPLPPPEGSIHRAGSGVPIPSAALGSFPEKLSSCQESRGLEPRLDLVIERTPPAPYPEAGPGRGTLNSDLWLSFSKVCSESLWRFWLLTLLLGQKGKDVSLSPVSRLLSRSSCLCEPRGREHLGTPLPVWPDSLIKHSEHTLGVGRRARTWDTM